MADWLDAIPNLGVPGVPGVPPQKSAGLAGTPRKIDGVPGVPPPDPRAVLRDWHRHLIRLDCYSGPAGYAAVWWERACNDAYWIYENFASRAVRQGWSAADLFGVLPWHHGWGGLCDRLQGARNLKLDGAKASWSTYGIEDWTCADAGEQLISSGLMLIWELKAAP